ncbi:MAG: AmmeMemoRadiSam system protein B [Ardenticatenales bacterium]
MLVVPHHDLAAVLITAGLRAAIDEDDAPRRVVLVGVDHQHASAWTAATSARAWQLPDGLVHADIPSVQRAIASRRAGEDGALLALEHSIAGLVPYVAAAAPGATLVPLAVRPNARLADVQALAEAIDPTHGADPGDDGTLIVAAVDFAHDLPPAQTAANGRTAARALAALDDAAMGRWDDAFADGRGALRLAMALARRAGAVRWTPLAVTDSRSLPGWAGGGVTGYVVGCWGR